MLEDEFIVLKLVLNIWDKEMIQDIQIAALINLFTKRFLIPGADKQPQPIKDWGKFTFFFAFGILLYDFL